MKYCLVITKYNLLFRLLTDMTREELNSSCHTFLCIKAVVADVEVTGKLDR